MKTVKFLLVFFIALNVAFIGYYFMGQRTPKIAYVDNIELFNGFNFKKERQTEYERQRAKFQGRLDTLRMNHVAIEQAYRNNPADKELEKRWAYSLEYYKATDYGFATRLDSMDTQFNAEVWGKINAYVTEFGKEKNYDMVIGASGTGSLMYGSDAYNITEDVLQYINGKYEGN